MRGVGCIAGVSQEAPIIGTFVLQGRSAANAVFIFFIWLMAAAYARVGGHDRLPPLHTVFLRLHMIGYEAAWWRVLDMIIDGLDLKEWQKYAEQILGKDYFRSFFSGQQMASFTTEPQHNLFYNSSEIIVLVNLPYVFDLSQIQVYVKEQEVVIKGKIDLGYEHMQCIERHIFSGEFDKKILLPCAVNTKKVNAQYQRGILTIQLFPKLKQEGSSIRVKER